ncbi:MAG: hypothetical protein AAB845_01120 [Patescibacteria group bacterium]
MNQVLEQYRQEIIEIFGLEDVSPEKQDDLLAKIGEVFLKRLFLATIDKLGAQGAKDYQKLIESNADVDTVEAFLAEKIPNYPVFIRGVVTDFKSDMDKYSEVASV